MRAFFADVRFELRNLARRPAFTAVALATLALGIGANTAIFSVVDAVLFRPLSYPESERLVTLCERHPSVEGFCIVSPPDAEDFARESRTLEALGIGRSWPFSLRMEGGADNVNGGLATPGYFRALGVTPALGRLFLDADQYDGIEPVVVLSHGLWQERFGSDPEAVGRTILLDEKPFTVVGVLPAGFEAPHLGYVRLWRPLHFEPTSEERRFWRGFGAVGRLAPGASVEQARAELSTVASRLAAEHPETNEGWTVSVLPLHEEVVGYLRPRLLVFLGAVGLVLLIACANLANLLLARGTGREQELAVRTALGAGRGRLVRQLLSEGLVLSLLGGAIGLILAIWGTDLILARAPGGIPRLDEVSIDGRVLLFALLLSLVTSLLFGLVPALRITDLNVGESLKEGRRTASGRTRSLRGGLVIAEVALALVLLVGAGLLVRSFATLTNWEPGFEQENLLTFSTFVPNGKYRQRGQVAALFDRVTEELEAVPGVVSVGMTSAGPLFGGREPDEFVVEGMDPREGQGGLVANRYDVSAGYFETMGISLVRGRFFTEGDRIGTPPVAIVNDAFARRYFGDEGPLGRQLRMVDQGLSWEIVGVVDNVRPFLPGETSRPEVYWPNRQLPRYAPFFVVRTAVDPATVTEPIRARIEAVDPDLDLGRMATMEDLVRRRLVSPGFNLLLLGLFGAVAMVLAATGIYGVIAYSVAQRTREIGIRIALGARRMQIVRAVVGEGFRLALVGVLLGVVGALVLTRLMTGMLHGVEPTDPLTFLTVPVVLAVVAVLACLVPARRASRLDPLEALRHE